MGTINKQINRYEISAVYTHPQAKVDIVLVHGLNGEPERTWKAKNSGVYWPADLLPASLKGEPVNILVYGYNADVYARGNDKSPSTDFIHQRAQTLVTTLSVYRRSEGTTRNPIIWVAHSLGGILVKRALLYSNDVRSTDHEPLRSIYVSTYGIVFLGTPHTGSDVAAWAHMLQAMSDAVIPRKLFASESVLLKTLKRDNETLQNINSHFLDIYQRFKIHMAYECQMTDFKTSRGLVVDQKSASPQLPGVTYFGIEATHSGMCKFESNTAPGYRNTTGTIYEWVLQAPPVIQVRWDIEHEERRARATNDVNERIRPFMPTSPPSSGGQGQTSVEPNRDTPLLENRPTQPRAIDAPPPQRPRGDEDDGAVTTSPFPLIPVDSRPELAHQSTSRISRDALFIHPEPFRPNSYHVGRESEMHDLHKLLRDPGRRKDGTSAVLIQGMPGGGKTHLARQYVFKHRADYTGGVYWVRSKSMPEMESWFWRIAKTEAIRESMEDVARDMARSAVDELRDPSRIIDIVRVWFESFDDWLLIFDGIHFEDPGVERFIPGRPHTSIIFTSTNKAVKGDYNFNNPEVIRVDPLKAQEAQELLLTEMDKKKPWTVDDRNRATELVGLMGRLPLMIHITAQQLKRTQEPLTRYLKAYKKRLSAQAGSLTAYRAVYEQLQERGASAALNLMSILCFFDQHVPVEMLALGLSALDNRTPVRTYDASHRKATLNNTLGILIMFALVDRVESDDMSPTSSRSSKQSFDRNIEHLDLLRMHSVVQAFFIQAIIETKSPVDEVERNEWGVLYDPVLFWLERAAAVFCRSHDQAERRIRDDANMGLPDDYRRYAIHASKLMDNLDRLDKKHSLVGVRDELARRAALIQQAIGTLSHRVQSHIVTVSGESGNVEDAPPTTSVFDERTSSQSDTDSPESRRSLSGLAIPDHRQPDNWMPAIVGSHPEDSQWVQQHSESPTMYAPAKTAVDDHNPYHFHVPVPPYPEQATMPPHPALDGDDGDAQTVVPAAWSPRILSPQSPPLSPAWQLVGRRSSHRAIKKNESKRYHDWAGAWRDRTVSDPRSSISRETAKGTRFSADEDSQSRPGSAAAPVMTAPAGAKMILSKLKARSPPPKVAAVPAQSTPAPDSVLRGQTSRVASRENQETASTVGATQPLAVKPKPAAGTSWASVAAGKAATREPDTAASSPAESSTGPLKEAPMSGSPSSWTAAFGWKKFLKENLRPKPSSRATTDQTTATSVSADSRRSDTSGDQITNATTTTVNAAADGTVVQSPPPLAEDAAPGSDASASPRPDQGRQKDTPPPPSSSLFLGSRSAHSSPGQSTSPFQPPLDVPKRNTLGGGLGPGAVQRWESQIYHPGRSRLEVSELEEDGFVDEYPRMTRSMPSMLDAVAAGEVSAEGRGYQQPHPRYSPKQSQQWPNQQPHWPQQQRQPYSQQHQHTQPSYQLNVHPPQTGVIGGGLYAGTPPDGYSSLPMSRNTSAGAPSSSLGGGSGGQPIPIAAAPTAGGAATAGGGAGGTTRSSPTGAAYPSYRSASPHKHHVAQFGGGGGGIYGHTPSDTRTEPSPRMGPSFFPDVDTSYRKYEERHALSTGLRHRADSSGGAAAAAMQQHLGRGGSSASAGGAYSRSQSPSPSGLFRVGARSSFPTAGVGGGPPPPLSFTTPAGSSPDLSSRRQSITGAKPGGGEEMATSGSGSGGIRLGDGRIIEFGNVPVDVVAAGQRARRLEREISMGSRGRASRSRSREGGDEGGQAYGLAITD